MLIIKLNVMELLELNNYKVKKYLKYFSLFFVCITLITCSSSRMVFVMPMCGKTIDGDQNNHVLLSGYMIGPPSSLYYYTLNRSGAFTTSNLKYEFFGPGGTTWYPGITDFTYLFQTLIESF